MISEQTKHRIDVIIVLYLVLNELFDENEEEMYLNELAYEELVFPSVSIDEQGNKIQLPPIDFPVFPNPCGKRNCCGWHSTAARDILSELSTDEAFEDDGIRTEFVRKLLQRIFEKVGEHYKYYDKISKSEKSITPSTIQNDCTRNFGIKGGINEFFRLFLKGLTANKPNPITVALENKLAGDENSYQLEAYVKSLNYYCITNLLY